MSTLVVSVSPTNVVDQPSDLVTHCCACGRVLPAKVLHSAAGYYLGHECEVCGPHDRFSDYSPSKEKAEAALARVIELLSR